MIFSLFDLKKYNRNEHFIQGNNILIYHFVEQWVIFVKKNDLRLSTYLGICVLSFAISNWLLIFSWEGKAKVKRLGTMIEMLMIWDFLDMVVTSFKAWDDRFGL